MADGREHNPNLTVSGADEQFNALPRDPNQQIHKKPRVFLHRPNEDPADGSATVMEAAKTIQPSDFANVHKTPCFRNAMLPSISSGVGIGALRFVMGGSIFSALNWTSASFVLVSVAMYNRCQWQRRTAKDNIRKAAAVLDEKEALKGLQKKADAEAKKQTGPSVLQQADSSRQGTPFWSSFKFW